MLLHADLTRGVPQQERAAARKLFVSADDGSPTSLALSISTSAGTAPSEVRTFEPGGGVAREKDKGRLLTPEEKKRVKAAIEKAGSVEEVRRLQRMLADGFIPSDKDLGASVIFLSPCQT
jgi:U2 small nuclear ribonucleoprotein A'